METKELLAYLGVEADSIDKFKEQFQDKFIVKSEAPDEDAIKSATVGRFTGSFKTLAKKHFGLDTEEMKKAEKWEDLFEMGVQKQNAKIEELKLSSTQTNDSAIKDLTEKLERANQTAKEYKDANDLIKNTLTEKETEWNGKLKGTKAQFEKKNALFLMKDKISDSLTKGDKLLLETEINGLQIDFGDNDEVIVKDKEGKRLPNPKQVGTFLGLSDAIELIAEKEGFLKRNNATSQRQILGQQQQHSQDQSQRQVHPNAVRAAQ